MPFLGHYWGIDEVGVFVIPAVLAVIGLRWIEKRVRARDQQDDENEKVDVD